LSHLPDDIRRAIEITPAAGITHLCSGAGGAATDWQANLLANPTFTFHLKNGIRADLSARAPRAIRS
jgi:hypothetical protein